MKRFLLVTSLAFAAPSAAQQVAQQTAQRQFAPDLEVRLFPLQYLKPSDAAKLVSPFVFESGAGVFEAGAGVQAITVRATRPVLIRVDSLLKLYDDAPTTLNLRFQILAGSDSAWRDDAIAPEVQNSLRSLFRFAGYRMIAQGTTTVSSSRFSLTLHAADESFILSGGVDALSRGTGARGASAQLSISLSDQMRRTTMLSTGLSVPVGETVIVGSAAGAATDMQRGRTLILVVRTEPVSRGAR